MAPLFLPKGFQKIDNGRSLLVGISTVGTAKEITIF